METKRNTGFNRIAATLMDNFGISRAAAMALIIIIASIIIFACFWFFYSAPPKTITITCGEKGSLYYRIAERYAKVLARDGVKLIILPSEGSKENLQRLANRSFKVDIGFVQTGLTKGENIKNLVSLGSIANQPLMVFYIGAREVDILSQFKGKRLAIGPEGSGTRALALGLLAVNGIEPNGTTTLLDIDDDQAVSDLLSGKIDAVFLMADSASAQNMRKLTKDQNIRLVNFSQAEGYLRRFHYLNKLVLPKGAIDFGSNMPDKDVHLLSPSVELIARKNLHSALSDLLLAAATEIHNRPTLYQKRGEFPSPVSYEFPLSDDAQRFFKSGKSFFFRYLPFWLASLFNRILVVFVPLVLILIPAFKSIPALYRWKVRLSILKWYRALLVLEQEMIAGVPPTGRTDLSSRIDEIEKEVNKLKIPASFADQFYILRGHIGFVRTRLENKS